MKEDIILIGGGGHCKSCIDVIEQNDRYNIAGIIDLPGKVGDMLLGYPIIGCDNDIDKLSNKYNNFLITIGQIKSASPRYKLFSLLKEKGVTLPVVISPNAYVSKHAEIGEGTIIMHHAFVNAGAIIGPNCIINTKALIEHDVKIGAHCHISTGAVVNGDAIINAYSFIGSQAMIREGIRIEERAIVAGGKAVYKDISSPNV